MTTEIRERVRAGDPDAFAQLFDEHARAVYNHGFRLTADWSTAEEIMAMTFLEAWRLRGRVDAEGGSLLPWLLGIATNTARNFTRGARRRRAALARLSPDDFVVPDFSDDSAGRLDDVERLRAVHAAMGRLRRAEREVISLCVWAGLDYASAAEALGLPVGTVRSRLSRARAKLQRLVADDPGGLKREPARRGGQVEVRRAPASPFDKEADR
ncbi:RNA polymerase sigma factor [Marinactinospora thermotolerans]|uniref:RNA polymerase sigma-70 factor, ECF subfamily n=1 Tax=Marinactinospora thermotolerans DSM 45154 TaxID=1122192 RepID=A0A1T4Q5S0_9ACTN|nr:RNA polymerase sigma factor [Marinactinospora thermotolerans]SJZ99046.1 RNA polymerase sigma-70 factor, ECF subfamily [Marinactinospora thermotolerans DSM 45154]